MTKPYYLRDLSFENIHYKRRAYQWDPKQGKFVHLTLYLRSKQGKLSDVDRIFLIGILNEDTRQYEEYALTEDEPFEFLEAMYTNDWRIESQIRCLKKLKLFFVKFKRLFRQKTGKNWEDEM